MSGFGDEASRLLASQAEIFVPAAITAHIPKFESESEDGLARRFKNRWTGKQEELTFEFTKDPALIHQYHRIYEDQFRAVHNANRYHHNENDEHDSRAHIVVVRRGNFCVGGARFSAKTPRQQHLLPIEIDGFRFKNHFPELELKQMNYAQIGRFCLLPEFRGGNATQTLLWHLYRKSVATGMDVVFGTAPIFNARMYLQNASAMGFKDAKLHRDIELPKYPLCEEIKFYLISLQVGKEAKEKDMAETREAENIG